MASVAGQPVPLAYGYVWGTGIKIHGETLQNTGNSANDWTRVAGYVLGEDEWDGLEELWDSVLDRLLFTNELANPAQLHFHRGCDAVIGSGLSASSAGPDQGVDSFHQYLPAGVQPLTYNRMASYWLYMKNKVNNPEDDNAENPNNFADLNPIGMWRARRVRIFDETGAMTGYAFSTNPAWQMCDAYLKLKLFPEYKIDLVNGADDLTNAVRARMDWGAWAQAAADYDVNNLMGNWFFSQPGTAQAVLSPMLQSVRSYSRTGADGRFGIYMDKPRASVFTISRANMLSFPPSDADLSTAANRFVVQFRDLLIPAINGHIVSIAFPDHGEPTVTMSEPHPLAANDRIVIGNTDTTYDTYWTVDTVPSGDSVYTFTMKTRGSNYPSSVGDVGGLVGLSYSRFKERSPEWNHKTNQLARGALGVGIPRQRKKVPVTYDFNTTTFDQASRAARYERDRSLGMDAVPYVTPAAATAELDLFALDAAGSGNVAIGIENGDRITVDDTASVTYAGEYEVLETTSQKDSSQNGQAQAGKVTLKLGPYNEGYMYDSSDLTEAGYVDVPGSEPGNSDNQTEIPLADGVAAFYTGIAASGDTLPVPTGYNANSFQGWAGAAGYVEQNHQLHCFRNCDFDPVSRILSCVYSDGNDPASNLWNGDNSYAGLVSRSLNSVTTSGIGPMTYRELTLLGGEKVLFGSGLVSGTGDLGIGGAQPKYTVALPDGYTLANSICLAFMKDGIEVGDNDAHGFAAWVDAAGGVHSLYQDGEGNRWIANNVRLFVFAWKNNMGTVVRDSLGWWKIPLSGTQTLAWAGFDLYDAGLAGAAPPNHPATPLQAITTGTLPLPAGFTAQSLQAISGPLCFQIVDHPTHGIRDCYINGDLQSLNSFEDGEGHIWYGTAGAFALLCDRAPATGNPV